MAHIQTRGLILAAVCSGKPSLAFINEHSRKGSRVHHSSEHRFPQRICSAFLIRSKLSSSNCSDLDDTASFFDNDELPALSKSTWQAEDDWSALSATDATASLTTPDYAFANSNSLDLINDAEHILAEDDNFFDGSNRYVEEWEPSITDSPIHHDDTYVKDHTDQFVDDAVETILNHMDYDENAVLYDTQFSNKLNSHEYEMDQENDDDEMVYMIRCNQSPEQFLVSQGKVLPELTDTEKYSPEILFEKNERQIGMTLQPKMTTFFKSAVEHVFGKYSMEDGNKESVIDRHGLALWMTTCLSYNLKSGASQTFKIGQHDSNISKYLSRYCSNNGSGQLTLREFTLLYLECAWVGYLNDVRKNGNAILMMDGKYHPLPSRVESIIVSDRRNTDLFLEDASLNLIWRDLEAHGVFSPVEEERIQVMKEMEELLRQPHVQATADNDVLMDECELLDQYEERLSVNSNTGNNVKTKKKSSHELVEMAHDGDTPKRIRDGEFVFIDEESCIGCSQCATIAPGSFKMLEDSGRARTFHQRNTDEIELAVMSCPVNCMHMVSFDELREMELSRDEEGFGGKMHHVPVHVAGRDSDANRKSSWYHYLKAKCGSTSCPQRGCYDCPKYAPGENPFFKSRHRKAEHIRASDFIASGDAEQWRKVAEI